MRAEGDKRELKVIENRKEEGETRENRKEKELMRDEGTSNEQEELNKDKWGESLEDIALSEREGGNQKDKQVKKGDEGKVENLGKGGLHEREM